VQWRRRESAGKSREKKTAACSGREKECWIVFMQKDDIVWYTPFIASASLPAFHIIIILLTILMPGRCRAKNAAVLQVGGRKVERQVVEERFEILLRLSILMRYCPWYRALLMLLMSRCSCYIKRAYWGASFLDTPYPLFWYNMSDKRQREPRDKTEHIYTTLDIAIYYYVDAFHYIILMMFSILNPDIKIISSFIISFRVLLLSLMMIFSIIISLWTRLLSASFSPFFFLRLIFIFHHSIISLH